MRQAGDARGAAAACGEREARRFARDAARRSPVAHLQRALGCIKVLLAAWLPEVGGLGSSGAAFQNWHFLLMIVAVGFCMGEAVMAYR